MTLNENIYLVTFQIFRSVQHSHLGFRDKKPFHFLSIHGMMLSIFQIQWDVLLFESRKIKGEG